MSPKAIRVLLAEGKCQTLPRAGIPSPLPPECTRRRDGGKLRHGPYERMSPKSREMTLADRLKLPGKRLLPRLLPRILIINVSRPLFGVSERFSKIEWSPPSSTTHNAW